MKRRIKISILLLLLFPLCVCAADINLEREYKLLDEAISKSNEYVQEREDRIQKTKAILDMTSDAQIQYETCRRLYEEYQSYINDSAIYYIDRCISLAEKRDDHIHAEECRLLLAYQCCESGMYHEAMDILQSVGADQIDDARNRQKYYSTLAHLYTEVGYYCRVPRLQR